tara:strand:+ start:117 stop:296 length:180 start_codon:yes stop_codon:yes gene_type:complete
MNIAWPNDIPIHSLLYLINLHNAFVLCEMVVLGSGNSSYAADNRRYQYRILKMMIKVEK